MAATWVVTVAMEGDVGQGQRGLCEVLGGEGAVTMMMRASDCREERPVLWSSLRTCNENRPTQTWSPSSCLQGNPLCLSCTSPKVTWMCANHIPVRVRQHLPAPETEVSTGSHGDTAVT